MPETVNCACQEGAPAGARTLLSMRQEVMVRTGFAAQLAHPPPGTVTLFNSFLRDSQAQLYRQHPGIHTERFFTWELEAGTRFYGLAANADDCAYAVLDPLAVEWVGVEDANGVWYELRKGIPPEFYTMTQDWQGWPSRYEIRECIEIFPAPSADMTHLRIKGHFGLRPFAADEDITTINADALFLWALATAKAHYGKPDADVTFQQANALIARIVAGSHHTARYVPGTRARRPLTPPRFLPLEE